MERDRDLPTRVRSAIQELKQRLDERFSTRLRDFRLFGSYARGDWHEDSDVDVVIVVEGLDRRERDALFDISWEVRVERMVPLAPLALSTDEWRTLTARGYLLASDIEREGIAL
jgi:uncharacterized protein